MATRTIKVCDKHASADPNNVITGEVQVGFSFSGQAFTLDLCTECKKEWDLFFQQFEDIRLIRGDFVKVPPESGPWPT